jgi:hypothetical protein
MDADDLASVDAIDELWEWAWQRYNTSAMMLPDCEHNRVWKAYNEECRKIQAYGLRKRDRAIRERQEGMPRGEARVATRTTRSAKPAKAPVLVVATFEMSGDIFVKHFNNRHQDGLAGMTSLIEPVEFATEQLYRAFHWRIHNTEQVEHYHAPDPPEASVDRAIECLIENHNWGWKELAGMTGFVAVFPDGKIATRVDNVIEYHETIEATTDRLTIATEVAAATAANRRRRA